jgi:hypothetical protein
LIECFRTQGIDAILRQVDPIDAHRLLIKGKTFPPSTTSGFEHTLVKLGGQSIPAQGNHSPPPVFNVHYIVLLTITSNGTHYLMDPSYDLPKLSSLNIDSSTLNYQNSAFSGFGDNSTPTKFLENSGVLRIWIH